MKKADKNCKECHGTGEVANTHMRGPEWLLCDCTISVSMRAALDKIHDRRGYY